jgi:hypothetical protein
MRHPILSRLPVHPSAMETVRFLLSNPRSCHDESRPAPRSLRAARMGGKQGTSWTGVIRTERTDRGGVLARVESGRGAGGGP